MLTTEMNLSILVHCIQDLEMLLFVYVLFKYGLYLSSSYLEMLLFVYVLFKYGLYLSSSFIVFGISLFRFYSSGRSLPLISLKLQQQNVSSLLSLFCVR
jgi:hypothetical protein